MNRGAHADAAHHRRRRTRCAGALLLVAAVALMFGACKRDGTSPGNGGQGGSGQGGSGQGGNTCGGIDDCCNDDTECCSGSCSVHSDWDDGLFCAPVVCVPDGQRCALTGDCCAIGISYCAGEVSGDGVCTPCDSGGNYPFSPCTYDSDCCSNSCGAVQSDSCD